MRRICLAIIALAMVAASSAPVKKPKASGPKITLFQSIETVKQYLATKAKQDYSDKYLDSVCRHYSQGHPRKGDCWLYHFAYVQPRMGGEVSIYHFMDGKIIEFKHGP
jgi:hypothetical protein